MYLYAVRDSAVDSFGFIICARSRGEALRTFTDEVNGKNNPNSPIAAHPDDYELYEIGIYDEKDASILAHTDKERVARAKDLKFQE